MVGVREYEMKVNEILPDGQGDTSSLTDKRLLSCSLSLPL